MTNEERDLISRFIERVAGAQAPGQPLPPLDPDADKLITDLFARYPEARYRITQLAMVQEHALVEAQNRITRLQWELQQAQQAQAPQQQGSPWGAAAAPPPQPQQSRGFFSGLFGGSAPPPPPPRPQSGGYAPPPPNYAPPPPQYPAGYNPGMFQQQGSGFLGSALRTAAGVAGGVVAADALMGLFGHHGGGFGGGWGGGPTTIVEQATPAGFTNPWGASGGDAGDYGGAPKEPLQDDKFAGPAQIDQADWQNAPDQGGWQNAGNDPGVDQGGWQDASSDPGPDQGGWDQASDDGSGGGWDDTQDT